MCARLPEEPEVPEPPTTPSPEPVPWHDPGPPVRKVDLPPDSPTKAVPLESPDRTPAEPGRG